MYRTLLDKLEQSRHALGGQVFDVLGKLHFEGRPLRELLIEAIRYGDRPEVRARLDQAVSEAVDKPHLQSLIEEQALAHDAMDSTRVARVREEMERAEARRLQPHYIEAFFREAFRRLGGSARRREPGRYEITHVPAAARDRKGLTAAGGPVLRRYERIAFDKQHLTPQGRTPADFVCPGHPLLDAVLDLTLERHRGLPAARDGAGRRPRPGRRDARALHPGTLDPGRQRRSRRRGPGHLAPHALRGDRRGGKDRPPAPGPLPRLPAPGR